jgi:protein N-terminal methyltransferase
MSNTGQKRRGPDMSQIQLKKRTIEKAESKSDLDSAPSAAVNTAAVSTLKVKSSSKASKLARANARLLRNALAKRASVTAAGESSDGKEYSNIQELWKQKLDHPAAAVAAAPTPGPAPGPAPAPAPGPAPAPAPGLAPAAAPGLSGSDSKDMTLVQDESGTGVELANDSFFDHGKQYWANIDATDDGMLGGFERVDPADVKGSTAFLKALPDVDWSYALDCGAGIGRVTRNMLLPLFECVDLVEQNGDYVKQAETLTDRSVYPKMGEFFVSGLQQFVPVSARYSVIWIQWVIGHLPDTHMIAFLKRCAKALKPGGYICLKENNVHGRGFEFDEEDGSVTRSNELFLELFAQARMSLIKVNLQRGFPKELLPVRMYALQPMDE